MYYIIFCAELFTINYNVPPKPSREKKLNEKFKTKQHQISHQISFAT